MSEEVKVHVSRGFARILEEAQVTVAFSTYQAGKLMLLSARDGRLMHIPKNFIKPMGIALEGDRLAVACLNEVRVFKSAPRLAGNFPAHPNFYSTLFMPRGIYFSGTTDLHDLYIKNGTIWGVNTLFSCLCTIDHEHSFTPEWQPWFISELAPEDRCHLNGLAFEQGKPKYVSCLGAGNVKESWREGITEGGAIMDVQENRFVLTGLAMPHSPRVVDNSLYFLQSANGILSRYDRVSQSITHTELPGFPRGMAYSNGLLFIGMSKIRKSSKSFDLLPIRPKATWAGIVVIEAASGLTVGEVRYENTIDEIYDVQVVPERFPFIVNKEDQVHEQAIAGPDFFYWRKRKGEAD
jgi:uncharacterized protein (TIGR03032 family)